MVDMPQFPVPEFVGRALYGTFTIVMVVVLLNMLIAMITGSFQKIEVWEPSPGRGGGGGTEGRCSASGSAAAAAAFFCDWGQAVLSRARLLHL